MFCLKLLVPFILTYNLIAANLVNSLGNFTVSIQNFTNVNNFVDEQDNCCYGKKSLFSQTCARPCNLRFRICLHVYMRTVPSELRKCAFWEYNTGVLGQNVLQSNDNEFTKQLTKWKGSFMLFVEVYNRAANPMYSDTLVMRSVINEPDYNTTAYGSTDLWRTVHIKKSHMSLTYSFRFQCEPYLHGSECGVYCKPRDDLHGHWTCDKDGVRVCMQGYGGESCDKPICAGGCQQDGQCLAPDKCRCKVGWEGKSCEKCMVFPGCQHGTCRNSFECNCRSGYGGMFCNVDLNWCTRNKNPCLNGGICLNRKGHASYNYTCSCPNGFSGTHCERFISDCSHHPCFNGGKCENNSTTCTCSNGFYGPLCQFNQTTCADQPCQNKGRCVQLPGVEQLPFRCICEPGWSGRNCDINIDDCAENPCQNDGRCADQISGYICVCRFGFKGAQCQINVDDCHKLSCLNGGVCQDHVNRVDCNCAPGFTGPRCEININDCANNPCQNGARCQDAVNDYLCFCPRAFTGKRCEFNASDPCATGPCRNGGVCQSTRRNEVLAFSCTCPKDFSGLLCESHSVSHAPNPPLLQEVKKQLNLSTVELLLVALLGVIVPILVILAAIFLYTWRRHRRILLLQRYQFKSVLPNDKNPPVRSIHNQLMIQEPAAPPAPPTRLQSEDGFDGCANVMSTKEFCACDSTPISSLIPNNKYNAAAHLKNKLLVMEADHTKLKEDTKESIFNTKITNQMANMLTTECDKKMADQEAHFRHKELTTSALKTRPVMVKLSKVPSSGVDHVLADPSALTGYSYKEQRSLSSKLYPSRFYSQSLQKVTLDNEINCSDQLPPTPPIRTASKSCETMLASSETFPTTILKTCQTKTSFNVSTTSLCTNVDYTKII